MIHTETPQSVDELDPWRPQGGRRVNQMGLYGSRHVTARDSSTKTSNGETSEVGATKGQSIKKSRSQHKPSSLPTL